MMSFIYWVTSINTRVKQQTETVNMCARYFIVDDFNIIITHRWRCNFSSEKNRTYFGVAYKFFFLSPHISYSFWYGSFPLSHCIGISWGFSPMCFLVSLTQFSVVCMELCLAVSSTLHTHAFAQTPSHYFYDNSYNENACCPYTI